ncbi:MAG: hypothetical protein KAW17_12365 [Candidatus Eisenbacteria sp.]|nr:hypothetical protein [Candidatus Eisenbacteria bacterium]
MMKTTALAACLTLIAAAPSIAGENPNAKLAMHVVASDQYLYCQELTPAVCESINVDVSIQEILAASGYGYIAFVAYDVEGLTGAEFAVSGWPSGRGAPQLSGPYWCPEGTLAMGEHLASGGIASFPCAAASANGLVLIGYCSFGPLDEEDLPVTLEYVASDFSYPDDPHNYVLDCTIDYQEDAVVAATGCTIGGTHEEQPDCPEGLDGGTTGGGTDSGEGSADDGAWPVVVQTGTLYVYGNRLDPPYVFTLETSQLFVNGVRLSPPLRRNPPRQVTVTDRIRTMHALFAEAMEVATSLLGTDAPMDTILATVMDRYRQSSVVDSVVAAGGSSIWVYWNNASYPYRTSVSVPTRIPSPLPVRDDLSISFGVLSELRHLLRSSGSVFFGNGYRVAVQDRRSEALDAELRILYETRDPNAEGLRLLRGNVAEELLDPLSIEPTH